jgi:hypothetical protein
VNCAAARDLMPELALGALGTRDAALIERHLAWCAACRKEAGDLDRAAALLPYALASAAPPATLEARVVGVVREAAGGRRTTWARRGRSGAAALIAAMVAVSGLGWGAVMAGRADRLQEQTRAADQQRRFAEEQLSKMLEQTRFADPQDDVLFGILAGPIGSLAGGAALELNSLSGSDYVIVSITGMPAQDPPPLPYTVTLERFDGASAMVGRIDRLNTAGGADVGGRFKRDLDGFMDVIVRDANGVVVVSGTLTLHNTVPSPSP